MKISKLDAVRRQLDCAIKLWFSDGDIVSIYTLVFAAFEILNDLNKKKGNEDVTLAGRVKRNFKAEHVEEVMALLKKPMVFFKHANRDPYDVLEFEPSNIDRLIALSLSGLHALGETTSITQEAFITWFLVQNPHLHKVGETHITHKLTVEQIQQVRGMGKREFLNTFLNISAKRAQV